MVSKDAKFYCASFGSYEKFVGECPPTQTPTQMLKSVFSILSSQETGSSSVSSKMIFGALQFELFRFKIHSLGSKILKFPEFNLLIVAFDEAEKSMSKIKSQDKKDGKGKHFQIQYGYENPDLFPKDHEWTIWITGLVSVTFMIYWFFKIKFGNDEINGEMRFLLKEDAIGGDNLSLTSRWW